MIRATAKSLDFSGLFCHRAIRCNLLLFKTFVILNEVKNLKSKRISTTIPVAASPSINFLKKKTIKKIMTNCRLEKPQRSFSKT